MAARHVASCIDTRRQPIGVAQRGVVSAVGLRADKVKSSAGGVSASPPP